MDFNNFDNFGSNSSGSRREKLEIGESGRTKGEEKRLRPERGNSRGFGNRNRHRNSGGGRGQGFFKIIANILFWGFMIFVLYLLNLNYGWVDLSSNKKLTQEEGMSTLLNATKEVHRDAGINSGVVEELDAVYENNNIFDGTTAFQMQDSVYLVYAYTLEPEKDELFNLFIESYGSDVPVYPVSIESLGADIGYNALGYEDSNRFEEPHFIMFSHVTGDENEPIGIYFEDELSGVITDFNSQKLENENKDEWR